MPPPRLREAPSGPHRRHRLRDAPPDRERRRGRGRGRAQDVDDPAVRRRTKSSAGGGTVTCCWWAALPR